MLGYFTDTRDKINQKNLEIVIEKYLQNHNQEVQTAWQHHLLTKIEPKI
ncbi:hypothetical protein [Nostoc sp.]